MRTISFYSYKGGTGRTLLVANIAVYAARLGLSVVMVDHDLEAPGLAYKFMPTPAPKPGVLEWLSSGQQPELSAMVQDIPLARRFNDGGRLQLIGAGPPPSNAYLRGVRALQSTVFADDGRQGVAGMLTLQDAIGKQLKPDLLLLDARTGITNTNAITTRVLADDVVALTIDSPEQLEGTRAVLRTLPHNKPRHQPGRLGLHVIVSRVQDPERGVRDNEISARDKTIAENVRRFLAVPADDLTQTLTLSEVLLLHNDAFLAEQESVYLADDGAPKRSGPLHFDYLRVARRLLGADVVEPAIAAAFAETDESGQRFIAGFLGRDDLIVEAKAPRIMSGLRSTVSGQLSEQRTKVRLLQNAARSDPSVRPDLAAALVEQAWAMHDADSGKAALQTMREAEHLYDELQKQYPEQYMAPYVDTLIQDSRMAAELGADGRAADKTVAAVDIVTGEPGLTLVPGDLRASALMSLADLRRFTDPSVAMDRAETAMSILDALGPSRGQDPSYLFLLATAHQLFATLMLDSGEDDDSALANAQAALKIYTQIADLPPADHRLEIELASGRATALKSIANIQRRRGQYPQAVEAADGAVDLLRVLAADMPHRYLGQLAEAFDTLSRCQADTGLHQQALLSADQAVHIWGDLLDVDDHAAHHMGLAVALNNLATVAISAGDYERALGACMRALDHLGLIESDVSPTGREAESARIHAAIWGNLAVTYRWIGDTEKSASAASLAVSMYESLGPQANPQRAEALSNLARILVEAGQPEQARTAATKAINVRRDSDAPSDLGFMAATHLFIARTHMPGEPAKAEPSAERSLDLYVELGDIVGRASATEMLAEIYSALGDDATAAQLWRDAKQLRSRAIEPPND